MHALLRLTLERFDRTQTSSGGSRLRWSRRPKTPINDTAANLAHKTLKRFNSGIRAAHRGVSKHNGASGGYDALLRYMHPIAKTPAGPNSECLVVILRLCHRVGKSSSCSKIMTSPMGRWSGWERPMIQEYTTGTSTES